MRPLRMRPAPTRSPLARLCRPSRRVKAVLAALAVASALSLAGCDGVGATPTPQYTAVPIGATPWPNGTTGQYGLRIDPSLLTRLPKFVGAQPIVEDAESEIVAMGNADLAKTFDGYVAAKAGEIADDNWLALVIGHFTPENQTADFYSAWVDQYAAAGCSQASAVTATNQETVGDFVVDEATCGGGPTVFTLHLDSGVVLSMVSDGPLDFGRQLIKAIY